jgi:hypothetical protein
MPTAAYKDGTLHKPGAGSKFGSSFLAGMAPNSDGNAQQTRPFPIGDKVYVMNVNVNLKKDRITFTIAECASCNGTGSPYKAAVSFEFAKGSLATARFQDVQDVISKVFTFDSSNTAGGAAMPPGEGQVANPAPGAPPASVYGSYADPRGFHLQLNPDGSFITRLPNGKETTGTFTVNGNALAMLVPGSASPAVWTIQGDNIDTRNGVMFVRQGPPPPPQPSLTLPATYTSAQAPADQLQLNTDHSFTLQEGGQTYHGTFTSNGNTVELTISESNTKSTATLQGNNLTDSSGQTWTLRVPSAGAPPGAGVLQNEDVIKMAKAGFDDGIIITKISGSKCQFDTSTDALIQLKQNGVSAAVIKAMMGAGK